MLEVAELRSGYGRLEILQGVSLSVAPGTIVGVIGPNGAGKSTLLKTIFGYLAPFAGRITLENRSLIGLRPDQMLKLGAGFVAQAGGLFAEMTVHENLLLGGYGLPSRRELAAAVDAAYERFPRLHERRRQPAGSLSGGEPHQKPQPFGIAKSREHFGGGLDLCPDWEANARRRRMRAIVSARYGARAVPNRGR